MDLRQILSIKPVPESQILINSTTSEQEYIDK